ncbi:MAG: methyltransferase domain-containing protein [Anaerolineae bacterium]|nr:methyltransferase domain-containing protein [Anaerolineae bacterium]
MPLRDRLRRLLTRPPRTLGSLDAYALWAASYPPKAHNPLMAIEQRAMLDLMPPLAGLVVLDLACGTGRYGVLAQARGARHVIEIDNSPAMLAANRLPQRAQATSEAIPLGNGSIDMVICGLALGHLPNLQESMDEIGRVLKPGGAALISDVHPFAALGGGRRTFRGSDGGVYAVEHYPHLYADYHKAALEAGLEIGAVLEPRHERVPVVLALRLYRRGRAINT